MDAIAQEAQICSFDKIKNLLFPKSKRRKY